MIKNNEDFGLYIHWPFCLSKCPYCDFNAHLLPSSLDEEQWLEAYLKEMEYYAKQTRNRVLSTVFFGGGTPSLMPPRIMGKIIDKANKLWGFVSDPELSMEANPTSSAATTFTAFQAAGINRLSLGVQSFNDRALLLLGRQHTSQQALDAIDLAHNTFQRVSFDLIYARPETNLSEWEKELEFALSLAPEHLSLYQLTIEPGTVYQAAVRRGDFIPMSEDEASEQFEFTTNRMIAAGLPAYEISNYAKLGQECRHNLIYWRYQDYLGIGPGAHGRFSFGSQKIAVRQHRSPKVWMERTLQTGHATEGREIISEQDMLYEFCMMGLRLNEGIDLSLMKQRWLNAYQEIIKTEKINWLQKINCLEVNNHRLKATDYGRQRLDSVLGALLS